MMDVDDGYILWTGIWKGRILWDYSVNERVITSLRSFHSLGEFKRFVLRLISQHGLHLSYMTQPT